MRPGSSNSLFTAIGGALALVASPAQAAPFYCFEQDRIAAARIHDLRVHLMVKALKCRAAAPWIFESYEALIAERSSDFDLHRRAVKAALQGRLGRVEGIAAFNTYETRIGNFHSGAPFSEESCADTAAFIRLASQTDDADLAKLSQLVSGRPIEVCKASPSAPATGAAVPTIAVSIDNSWAVPAPLPQAQSAPSIRASQIVYGIETFAKPGAGPDTKPRPLETIEPSAPAFSSSKRSSPPLGAISASKPGPAAPG